MYPAGRGCSESMWTQTSCPMGRHALCTASRASRWPSQTPSGHQTCHQSRRRPGGGDCWWRYCRSGVGGAAPMCLVQEDHISNAIASKGHWYDCFPPATVVRSNGRWQAKRSLSGRGSLGLPLEFLHTIQSSSLSSRIHSICTTDTLAAQVYRINRHQITRCRGYFGMETAYNCHLCTLRTKRW